MKKENKYKDKTAKEIVDIFRSEGKFRHCAECKCTKFNIMDNRCPDELCIGGFAPAPFFLICDDCGNIYDGIGS